MILLLPVPDIFWFKKKIAWFFCSTILFGWLGFLDENLNSLGMM